MPCKSLAWAPKLVCVLPRSHVATHEGDERNLLENEKQTRHRLPWQLLPIKGDSVK